MFDKLRKNTKKLAMGLFPILMGLMLFVGVSNSVTLDVVSDTVKEVVSDTIVPIVAPAFTFEVITSGVDTFQLPLEATGIYDFHVDWGDGSSSDITVWDHADTNHSYAGADNYVVKITGIIQGWSFNVHADAPLVGDLSSWGPLQLTSTAAFAGCTNLTISATDILDLSATTTLRTAFFNTGISTLSTVGWDISTITIIRSMLDTIGLIDVVGISDWDITAITNAISFLDGSSISTANYDALILSWSAQAQTIVANFDGGNSTYTGGGAVEAARDAWIAKGWVITDAGPALLFPFMFFGGKLRKKRYAEDYKTDIKKAA